MSLTRLLLPITLLATACDSEDELALETEDEFRSEMLAAQGYDHETFLPVVTHEHSSWGTTSITYQDLSGLGGLVYFEFISEQGDVIADTTESLNPDAAKSLYLGSESLALPPGFRGSVVAHSTMEVGLVAVQTGLGNRPMYSGMRELQAAEPLYFQAFESGSAKLIAAQNPSDAPIFIYDSSEWILPGESAFVPGSSVVSEIEASDAVVGASLQRLANTNLGSASQAVAASTETVMPTALCKWNQESDYTLYNPNQSPIVIEIEYVGPGGTGAYEYVGVGVGETVEIGTCETIQDFNGRARLSSSAPFAAFGSVHKNGSTGETGFTGQTETAATIGLPYVRWWPNNRQDSSSHQRTNIAIVNTHNQPVDVAVDYYDAAGGLARTHTLTIPGDSKANSSICTPNAGGDDPCNDNNPVEKCRRFFGDPKGNQQCGAGEVYGGGAVVRTLAGDDALIVLARVGAAAPTPGIFDAEDYNGIIID